MLIILGKTASGKSTVLNNLCKHGYKPLITYTSRPRRENESESSYHFIPEEDFKKKIDDGFFAEWCTYNTVYGLWYYGSARDDYKNADDKTVAILNPTGLKTVLTHLDIPIQSIYLYANLPTIEYRLKQRGDRADEIKRRLDCDKKDFKGIEMQVDKIVYNNIGTKIDDVVQKIMGFKKSV